ncbi:TPA: hypothetical protein L4E43_003532 [Pseudomonas aeruginosa]|uniref:hypothetical protein n=1 Tax=Pseudomonas aeruginosa TaxID=287 RepID=UPI000F884F86|nr:hypothetical protein [Pseudomonas aeruginosa]RUJ61442.1 hypothetical protein IPC331_07685 [Pseudomonas aeruginosa]HBO0952583.1 hypothetical protein [Pseudomonas aeruginosa]HBO3804946.1 hypothetical protein [Pseudomonas aeruginosa]HCT3917037.1 hypothetical protein [Pseudomonas aeruginosa]HCU2022854.1 hypothetical protein [Pseudomonas aeruginosa]
MISQYENIIGMRKKIDAQADHIRRLEIRIHELRTAQAQHSVPEGWMLVPVEPLLNMMSDKDHDTRITAERQLLSILAAAPGKEEV